MTLEEFLALPETEPPSEFICGEVTQKPMPSPYHAILVAEISRLLGNHLHETMAGMVMSDARHAQRAEHRAYLPDVGVILKERLPRDRRTLERGPLELVPDLAIEVLSPDDRPNRVAEKLAFYLRNNTPLVWVIDPIERTLDAHRPAQPSTTHHLGEVIDAAPVLPDFRLDLNQLFSSLNLTEE
jgi:Uma2 family endonuclease